MTAIANVAAISPLAAIALHGFEKTDASYVASVNKDKKAKLTLSVKKVGRKAFEVEIPRKAFVLTSFAKIVGPRGGEKIAFTAKVDLSKLSTKKAAKVEAAACFLRKALLDGSNILAVRA